MSGRYKGPAVGSNTEVMRQVLKGLEHIHLLKIVHGDLKPTNIMISIPSGAVGPLVKLTDFGLRHKSFSPSAGDHNREFAAACSESWMAPEADFNYPSDMYSFGLVAGFSLSNGLHPYGEQEWERISRIKSYQPMILTVDQLNHVDKEIAAQVMELIKSLLSKRPEERPTATQVLTHVFLTANKSSVVVSQC